MGGALGGRRFGRPERVTRPTSDRVREALASILASRGVIEGARVLELYAGTGACSFEMLSRGASHAVLVERDARASKDLDESARELGLTDQTTRLRLDLDARGAIGKVTGGPFDLVLVDPPYDAVASAIERLAQLRETGAWREGAWAVLEHRSSDVALVDRSLSSRDVTSSRLRVVSRYRYGDTTLTLLSADDASSEPPDSEPDLEGDDA